METLYFLKFWKPNPSPIAIPSPLVETDNEFEVEEEEEEDSFFDLEISIESNTRTHQESSKLYSKEAKTEPTLYVSSPTDPISKRKVLPIEPIPIALLKSGPKFGVSIFKKPKSATAKKAEKTGETESCILKETQKQKRPEVKGNGISSPAKLTRENSSRETRSKLQNERSDDSKTERFSKDVIKKYLKLIKPLYLKVSKRYGDKVKVTGDLPMASPTSSPAVSMYSPRKEKQGNIPAGIRVVCKHLGKSKSATAAMAVAPPVNRRDDSLLLQADGIQSAILHCKRSFNSIDSSCLSRSTSWTSSSMNSYSSESSMLSRFAVESHERSARSSIGEELACF
ncbi:membrane-associated kinase regulator 5 [Argentina anserina]|uniref:membrane-associated kinase regulator 5 n=1 Tax=Argentina anserina TaxID=57926 RepID=UPI0021768751|nr:membrane-associated kinase regulator 5 [Potentilla anserina]